MCRQVRVDVATDAPVMCSDGTMAARRQQLDRLLRQVILRFHDGGLSAHGQARQYAIKETAVA